MSLNTLASYALTILILGAASSLVTALLVEDKLPIGWLRERILRRWPPGGWDMADPQNPRQIKGSTFGYWWTCTRCAGAWVSFGWFAGWYWGDRGVTILVAVPFALAAVQRWINSRTG